MSPSSLLPCSQFSHYLLHLEYVNYRPISCRIDLHQMRRMTRLPPQLHDFADVLESYVAGQTASGKSTSFYSRDFPMMMSMKHFSLIP
jgi:hypothetical protein